MSNLSVISAHAFQIHFLNHENLANENLYVHKMADITSTITKGPGVLIAYVEIKLRDQLNL